MSCKPPKPLVYFSYGLTKSASTLAYRLAWLSLEDAGFKQPRLPFHLVEEIHSVNFVAYIEDAMMDELLDIAAALGHPLVVKTHVRPSPAVQDAIRSGKARGSISLRDPRDMALSMLDHGVRARKRGHKAFSEYHELPDTLDAIREQLDNLAEWLKLPDMITLPYEKTAFDPVRTAARLQAHMGIAGDPEKIARKVADRKYIQFNKGLRRRHRHEMSPEDSAAFTAEFTPLIALLETVENTPDDGRPRLPETARLRH